MATGDKCSITNCNTRIPYKGTICAKHRWRKKKFGSYDLPGYSGIPNYPVIKTLPEGILKICEIHGQLPESEVYGKWYKGKVTSYNCKQCTLNSERKRKFSGMTHEEYKTRLKEQNDVCKMCKKPETVKRNGVIKALAVDHCHKTGKIRSLLCQFCNALIGYAGDSAELLYIAGDYIKSHE